MVRDRLPQCGITERADAERGDEVEVRGAIAVPGFRDLVAVHVTETRHRAFDATPQLQLPCGRQTDHGKAIEVEANKRFILDGCRRRRMLATFSLTGIPSTTKGSAPSFVCTGIMGAILADIMTGGGRSLPEQSSHGVNNVKPCIVDDEECLHVRCDCATWPYSASGGRI